MKLAVSADPENAIIIRELLSVWEISWVSPRESDVLVVYGRKPLERSRKTVLIPSNSTDFESWTKHSKHIVAKKPGEPIFIAATPAINLSFTSEALYETDPAACKINDDFVIPKVDFVEEYKRILRQTLAVRSSVTYRLATSLPLPYNFAPKGLRDYLMKKHDGRSKLNICDTLPLDAVRFALANAIEKALKEKLHRKTWDHKPSVCVLTHDIDTKEGLQRSGKVKKLEEKYDLPSAWFIPSKQYSLDRETIEKLENNGEVGSHDIKHDGRLSHLSKKKLTERLREGKKSLESMTNHPVEGFRAPLLQHTSRILFGLGECGFKYDTSIPTWEPKHPRTMSPHGIGTLFPIRIEGMNEIPITIIQDHQLLHVLCLTPKEAITEWLSNMTLIKELGGTCVFLSHPEYGLLDMQGLPFYEELLNTLASDIQLLVVPPKKIPQLSVMPKDSCNATNFGEVPTPLGGKIDSFFD